MVVRAHSRIHKTSPFLLILLLVNFLASMEAVAKELAPVNASKSIKIAMIDYPPLMGINGGLMTDMAREAFKSQGIEAQFHILPMSRIALALSEGHVPAVLGTRAWSFLKEVVAVRIFYSGMNFFSLKSKFPNGVEFSKLEELKKYEIGYSRGGSLMPLFTKAGLVPNLVVSGDQNVKKLYFNRIDMFASTELAGWGIIEKYYPDKLHEFTMSENTIMEISGDIIFEKKQTQLVSTFRKGLNHIKKNGTAMNILKAYFKGRKIPDYLLKALEI